MRQVFFLVMLLALTFSTSAQAFQCAKLRAAQYLKLVDVLVTGKIIAVEKVKKTITRYEFSQPRSKALSGEIVTLAVTNRVKGPFEQTINIACWEHHKGAEGAPVCEYSALVGQEVRFSAHGFREPFETVACPEPARTSLALIRHIMKARRSVDRVIEDWSVGEDLQQYRDTHFSMLEEMRWHQFWGDYIAATRVSERAVGASAQHGSWWLLVHANNLLRLERYNDVLEHLKRFRASDWDDGQYGKQLSHLKAVSQLQLGRSFDAGAIKFKDLVVVEKTLNAGSFSGVDFANAQIVNSDLSGADVSSADLSDAHITSSRWTDATYDCKTHLPPDSAPEKYGMKHLTDNC